MIRLNYHLPGTPPATLLPRVDASTGPPTITLIQYDAGSIFEGDFDSFDEMMARFDPAKVNWVNIDGLNDLDLLRRAAGQFHIHPLALEDVLNTTQRPKVEPYDDNIFIVSEMAYFEESRALAFEQVSIFLGEGFLLTFQEEKGRDAFESVRKRLRAGRGFARQRQADYLAYALLDAIVDQFFPILEVLGDGIEEIEEELLDRPSKATLRRLYEAKRLLVQIRRASWPHREIVNALMRDESGRVTAETTVFLRDCYDHITQIIDIVESYRDISAGLMDVYLSSLGFRTNEIMRVLTVVSTFFIPLTFVAGVYGMNFNTGSPYNMPELHWQYGYLFFWGICASVAGVTFFVVKRNKWL
ncbi:MAG: magnesium/cobalt transporter CorA [Terrimicrobiaceae bacterium]|nr:magnesium/cobalt transporter CorA [Terrimicrobiaceae bacterium]